MKLQASSRGSRCAYRIRRRAASRPPAWHSASRPLMTAAFLTPADVRAQADEAAEAGRGSPVSRSPESPRVRPRRCRLQDTESVLCDMRGDLYLVSNVNGSPLAHDDNGSSRRLNPMARSSRSPGRRRKDGVRLHAPKGWALPRRRALRRDIDTIRVFSRVSGAPSRSIGIPGAQIPERHRRRVDGTLFVSDMGTGSIHRIHAEGELSLLSQSPAIGKPNGSRWRNDTLWVARMDAARVRRRLDVRTGGTRDPGPGRQLEASSCSQRQPARFEREGRRSIASTGRVPPRPGGFTGLTAPADIGFDMGRATWLIPFSTTTAIEARPLRRGARPEGRRRGGPRD